jgi:hypothetical protein
MVMDESRQQRERLSALRAREQEIAVLRERESDLEVERIAARAALARAQSQAPADMEAELASRLAGVLARTRELEDALAALDEHLSRGYPAGTEHRARLEAGGQALESWLATPVADEGRGFRLAVKTVLLVVTVAVIWAAVAIHPALLLVLVAVVGPVSFVLSRGQDAAWRRQGARKRFETTGLAPPDDWNEAAVRARSDALRQELLANTGREPIPESRATRPGEERAALAGELEEQQAQLVAAMVEAGLDPDDLDPATEGWLVLLGRAERTRRELESSEAQRKIASAGADELREGLYWYLSREGEAPGDGKADSDAIAAGLERLAARKGRGS